MIRRGALTLGAVLILGVGAGARGEDLSGPADAALSAGALPSWNGIFPRLPENWSDLPVQFKVSESVGYNSNILGLPNSFPVFGGLSRGDFQSISSFGVSTKNYWEGQQFFADASIGMTRYLHDVSLNSVQNAVDIGMNWAYTSRCSGKLEASESVAVSPFEQQVVTTTTTTLNNITTVSLNETGKCRVSGDYAAIFNSGVTRSTNSTLFNKLNDFRSVFVSAGVLYSVAQTNSLQALVTITGTDFTDRSNAVNTLGLLNNLTQDEFLLTYTKQFSPNLTLVASIGAVGVNTGSFNLAVPSGIVPEYSASLTWALTPKVAVLASAAKTVSPPTFFIGNAQINETASLSMDYSFSPKVSATAGVCKQLFEHRFHSIRRHNSNRHSGNHRNLI